MKQLKKIKKNLVKIDKLMNKTWCERQKRPVNTNDKTSPKMLLYLD